MPSGRIELPASGLLDQRSNPWAMKAHKSNYSDTKAKDFLIRYTVKPLKDSILIKCDLFIIAINSMISDC